MNLKEAMTRADMLRPNALPDSPKWRPGMENEKRFGVINDYTIASTSTKLDTKIASATTSASNDGVKLLIERSEGLSCM